MRQQRQLRDKDQLMIDDADVAQVNAVSVVEVAKPHLRRIGPRVTLKCRECLRLD